MDQHDSSPPEPGTPEPGVLPATVTTRARHDGWTPQKQHDFMAALAESGCVTDACAAVGMSPKSAYRLRARPDALVFRQSWDIALDFAVRRLGEAALSRALHGTVRPVYFQGEQVGERRYFDERLTMFILRTRDPVRFGAWRDKFAARQAPDGPAQLLGYALDIVQSQDEQEAAEMASAVAARHAEADPAMPEALAGPAADEAADFAGSDPLDDWFAVERVLRPVPAPPARQ